MPWLLPTTWAMFWFGAAIAASRAVSVRWPG